MRFAKDPAIAPTAPGPRRRRALTPTVRSTGAGEVLVSWRTSWDRDNENLTYEVMRNDNFASPVATRVVSSAEWDRPLPVLPRHRRCPGATATYRIVVRDPNGNEIRSNPVTSTVAGAAARPTPTPGRWPRTARRTTGASASPRARRSPTTPARDTGTLTGRPTRGVAGAIAGDSATRFDGTSNQKMYSSDHEFGPFWYTVEAWFNTTTTRGGKIVGFGTSQSGTSSSSQSDRTLYMDNSGPDQLRQPSGRRTRC